VVEHLLQVRRPEVAVLERLHRGEPPAGLAVRADDGGRDQRQRRLSGYRESLQSFPGAPRPPVAVVAGGAGWGERAAPPTSRVPVVSPPASSGGPPKTISPRSMT